MKERIRSAWQGVSAFARRRVQAFTAWLAAKVGMRAVSTETLRALKTELDRLRPLEHVRREDWVLVAIGGPLGGTFTPIPIAHTAIIPRWVDGKPERPKRTFHTPDQWEPYQEFAEAIVPAGPQAFAAIPLTYDEAMRLGYRPSETPIAHVLRQVSFIEGEKA